jgi:phasin family protein
MTQKVFTFFLNFDLKEFLMITIEQIASMQKANVEALFGLSQKTFESAEKLVDLNLQVSREALAESADNTHAVLSVKDAQELVALQSALLQPLAEKTAAYARQVYEIYQGYGAQLSKAAEEQFADSQSKFNTMVETAAKNAPAGSETAVAVLRSTVAAANNAVESVQKVVKQASELVDANVSTIARAASPAKTASKKRAAA